MKTNKEPYLTDIIAEMDNLPCCHPASVNIDVANTYYSIAKMLRPLLIVEIGCFIGFSTQHFAQAVKELGFGSIISIDAFDWEVDAGRGLQNRQEVAEYYRKKADVTDIITFVKGYSDQVYPKIKPEIAHKIDLLYIDGDHSIEGAFKDFNVYYDDVRQGGYIILHDIFPEMCGVDGPRTLLDTLKQSGFIPTHIEVLEMLTKDGFGIALLRKISNKPLQLSFGFRKDGKQDQEIFYTAVEIPNNDLNPPAKEHFVVALLRKVANKLEQCLSDTIKNDVQNDIIETPQVTFEIVDSESKQPIPNVKFICPQRFNEERLTLSDGVVQMPHYNPNRYLITLTADNYKPLENTLIDIPAGKTKHYFKLEMEKTPLN